MRTYPFTATLLLSLLPSHTTSATYLGLRNQGNTCYMNSLLQSLHHLPEFRRAIYSIPTSLQSNASATENLFALALQRLFFQLECGELVGASEVGTEQLTRSFGWTRADVMVQQDVQEFARMLCDALQQSMRAHGMRDAVAELFEGRTSSVTRCTRVEFSSEKEERFYDLSLPVQGCRSLHAALRQFVYGGIGVGLYVPMRTLVIGSSSEADANGRCVAFSSSWEMRQNV